MRQPSGIGITTIDGRFTRRKSDLSVLSDGLDAEKRYLAEYRRRYHQTDRQLGEALQAQGRLTSLVEASRLLSVRDNLRMQHTTDADVDELRDRHEMMRVLMQDAHNKMVAYPDAGAEGDFQQAVEDGMWSPIPIDAMEEARLFTLSKQMVGLANPSSAFFASAEATEIAAKHAATQRHVHLTTSTLSGMTDTLGGRL